MYSIKIFSAAAAVLALIFFQFSSKAQSITRESFFGADDVPLVEVTIAGNNMPDGVAGKYHIKQMPSVYELYYFLKTMNAFRWGSERIHIIRRAKGDEKEYVWDLPKLINDGKGKTTIKLKSGDEIAIFAY